MAVLTGGTDTFAQARSADKRAKQGTDNLNKTDQHRRKQGMWFLRHEARMGEPAYSEFGNYKDDRKQGTWYTVDAEGGIQSIEEYSRNVLNGSVQYYKKGKLVCTGNYRGLNPDKKFDSVEVVDINTYEEKLVAVPSEWGSVKHGIWRYYDPVSGKLMREEEYQVDDLIFQKNFTPLTYADSIQLQQSYEQRPHNLKKMVRTRSGRATSYTD